MLPDLNEIAASPSKYTLHTKFSSDMMTNYTHTYLNGKICYHVSNMILNFKSDGAYLFMTGACIHISGHYYLSNPTTNPTNP